MKFYIGSQIGLEEFDDVDISISWAEPPMFLSNITVVGNDRIAVVYSKSEEVIRVEDFAVVDYHVPFLVAVGSEATCPEVFHHGKSQGVKFAVIFERTSGMAGLMMFKYRTWAHAQESGLVIFGLADVLEKIHYGVYAPLEMTDNGSGIITEGSSTTILEVRI